jgi:hypothetical protein
MATLSPLARAAFAPLLLACGLATAQTATPQTPPASPAPTAAEQATLDAAFKAADTVKDGKLSNAELIQIPVLATKFADLDKNKDGFVTSDEFTAGVTVKPN